MAKIIVTLTTGERIVLVKTHDVAATKSAGQDLLGWMANKDVILFPVHGGAAERIREVQADQIASIAIENPVQAAGDG